MNDLCAKIMCSDMKNLTYAKITEVISEFVDDQYKLHPQTAVIDITSGLMRKTFLQKMACSNNPIEIIIHIGTEIVDYESLPISYCKFLNGNDVKINNFSIYTIVLLRALGRVVYFNMFSNKDEELCKLDDRFNMVNNMLAEVFRVPEDDNEKQNNVNLVYLFENKFAFENFMSVWKLIPENLK